MKLRKQWNVLRNTLVLYKAITRMLYIMNRYKLNLWKKKWMKFKWMLVCIVGGVSARNKYLKKHQIFAEYGDNNLFQPTKLPNAPQLIKIHNNVKIAADVTFYEHDAINGMLSVIDKVHYQMHGSCIEIHDNTFIGGHSIIIGNVSIGPNAMVAAGSVVTKDVEPGTIVGGNPAKVIGSFESLHGKRKQEESGDRLVYDPRDRIEELWKLFYEKSKAQQ